MLSKLSPDIAQEIIYYINMKDLESLLDPTLAKHHIDTFIATLGKPSLDNTEFLSELGTEINKMGYYKLKKIIKSERVELQEFFLSMLEVNQSVQMQANYSPFVLTVFTKFLHSKSHLHAS